MSIETLPSRDSSPVASVEEEKGDGAGGSVRAEGGMAWAYPPGAPGRILEFVCGNLFDVPDISTVRMPLLLFPKIGAGYSSCFLLPFPMISFLTKVAG